MRPAKLIKVSVHRARQGTCSKMRNVKPHAQIIFIITLQVSATQAVQMATTIIKRSTRTNVFHATRPARHVSLWMITVLFV